ncbi:MAG: peptide ABC transporter substrate-binding protein [Verrucomicrobiota bacterium]
MSADFPEADWRRFKEVHKKLLERYCASILQELGAVSLGSEGTAHERYLRAYKLIHERNDKMAQAFDDFRRSTACMQLAIMRRLGLLTDEDLSGFSEQTQTRVRGIASL